MRRVPLPVRFGTLLLSSALVFACAHRTRECTSCSSCNLERPYLRPAAAKCDSSCASSTTCTPTCTTTAKPCTTCPPSTPCTACPTTAKPTPPVPTVQPVPTAPKPTVTTAAPKSPATTDTKIPRVTIVSVEAREPSPAAAPATPKPTTVADTKIPRVTIVSVEGSLPATEPFAVPDPRSKTIMPPTPITPPAPPAPSRRENPPPLSSNSDSKLQQFHTEDMPAHPLATHAQDYSWLVGELRYVPERNVWTVRFTSEEEKFNTVTLLGPGPLTGLTSGQLVRVEGKLVASSIVEPQPGYQTHSVCLVSTH